MYGTNVHDAAYRLLQNPPPKRAKKADDDSEGVYLDELRAYILNDSKEMRECWSALNGLHQRTSEAPIDCEYVATLEATNAYVAYLAGIGIVTEKFATKFAEAVELNKRAAMTMTAEARQTKLSPGDTEEIYLIEPEDRPSKGARRGSYGDFFVSAKDSGADVYDDGELTPRTESASTGARLPVYDDFPGAYDDLEELGDWVTAGDDWDTLLSWDRIRSFGRFINGTHTNRAIVAAGTGIMLMGADFINPYVRAALFGGAAWALARSARRATAQAEDNDLAEWAAGLGAGGFATFAVALQQALTPPPAGLWWHVASLSGKVCRNTRRRRGRCAALLPTGQSHSGDTGHSERPPPRADDPGDRGCPALVSRRHGPRVPHVLLRVSPCLSLRALAPEVLPARQPPRHLSKVH